MNHRENDKTQENEGKQVQQELEEQLRAFGDTMSDAFAHKQLLLRSTGSTIFMIWQTGSYI